MPLVLEQVWLGRRVVVRRALPSGIHDLTGELRALDTRHATLRTREGADVQVDLETVVAARLVAASTREILALEAVAARGWVAAEVVAAHGWLLRADHGFSARANSVLALRSPEPDLVSALAAIRTWYADRGLPVVIALPLPARRALDQALERAGWPVVNDISMMVTTIEDEDQRMDARAATVPTVELSATPDADWLAEYHHPPPAPAAVVHAVLTRHDRVTFASIRMDGRVVAIGRAVVDDGWLGLSAIAVDNSYRRRGLAAALIAALTAWGAGNGATRSYLQVERTNTGAIALYRRLGFWEHHSYVYRRDPGPVTSEGPYDG